MGGKVIWSTSKNLQQKQTEQTTTKRERLRDEILRCSGELSCISALARWKGRAMKRLWINDNGGERRRDENSDSRRGKNFFIFPRVENYSNGKLAKKREQNEREREDEMEWNKYEILNILWTAASCLHHCDWLQFVVVIYAHEKRP